MGTAVDKKRSTNIELLRIVAMFLVLLMHALFITIGTPSQNQCVEEPGNAFFRLFLQNLSIVAVNIFILISGWFGIRPTPKKLMSLLFQVFFFTIGILLFFGFIRGFDTISPALVLKSFLITKGYWFVKSYICLFIISPVLNLFSEKADKTSFCLVLICFFLFQTVYGWTDSAPEFNYGYSVISFSGLYLLAKYIKMYPIRQLTKKGWSLSAYFIISLLLTIGVYLLIREDFYTKHSVSLAFSYINPFVILSSVALFLTFVNMDIPYSKAINWIAISAFAVYIIHVNSFIFGYFNQLVGYIYANYPVGLRSILLLALLALVFLICILLDKVRLFLWMQINHLIANQMDGRTIVK